MLTESRRRALVVALALLAGLLLVVRTRGRAKIGERPPAAAAPGERPLPVLSDVPAFAFTNRDGRAIDQSALRGHVWIADFIFTRCVTMCPITTAKMNVLRRAIPSSDVRFVSFSVDPDYDTPAVLRAYAGRWNADPRWLLLTGPAKRVTDLASTMNVPFQRTAMPLEPILHTSLFFLIDQRGRLRGQYASLDDASVLRLAADASRLAGASRSAPEPEAHGAPRGHVLYQGLGCAACHADPRTGPPLAGLAGRTVRLEGGASARADAAYLRRSVLAPAEQVVADYNRLMPAYAGYLAPVDVDDLVAYLQAL